MLLNMCLYVKRKNARAFLKYTNVLLSHSRYLQRNKNFLLKTSCATEIYMEARQLCIPCSKAVAQCETKGTLASLAGNTCFLLHFAVIMFLAVSVCLHVSWLALNSFNWWGSMN